MSEEKPQGSSRRAFLQNTGKVAAATALAGTIVPKVHAAEDNTIRLALVGCGGRGTGAVGDAFATKQPIKLVAMADVFPKKLESSYTNLKKEHSDQMPLTDEHKFIGFDGYRHAMDMLRPGDIVILTTPVAFRWVHFTYAIEKGLNVFMEKPIALDGPTIRKMFALGELAKTKNLKVAVGLMCRHCKARQNLHERIQDGAIGDITMLQAYRMSGPTAKEFADPRPKDYSSELLYQIEWFHSFLWASGGSFSDFLIHNIDESCWMKDAWPIKAQASGGRHYRGDKIDQNFDSYSVEYTFADGAKLLLNGRGIAGCVDEFASFAHGTKGSAIISTSGHYPAKCRLFKGQNFKKDEMTWAFPQPEPNPYRVEWEDFITAIHQDRLYNEVKRGTEASLVTAMGRMAAHTGQVITWDDMLNCQHEMGANIDKLTFDSPAPILAGADGKYPVPQPGILKNREYA